jgi:hypothetical protein
MEFIVRVINLVEPYWFKLFVSGFIIGALVAHNQRLLNG